MNRRPIRLLLVDDNRAVLRQVVEVLPQEFEVVEMLESGEGLQSAVEAFAPDVIVLDVTLPDENGITLASKLTGAGCPARIVFLTIHHDVDYVRSTLAAGASGYVAKMRLSSDLVPALQAAFEGRQFISPLPELSLE